MGSIVVLLLAEIPFAIAERKFNHNVIFFFFFFIYILGIITFLDYLSISGATSSWRMDTLLITNFILIAPVFTLYQWLFRWRDKKYELADREALKFIVIVFGLFITTFFLPTLDNGLLVSSQNIATKFGLILLVALPIALGNLTFNLGKHYYSMRGANIQLQFAKKEVLSSQSALNSLQSSVNPHFLYNALNSIATLAGEDAEKTQKMTLALADFYKYNTNRDEKPFTTIVEEIDMVKTYLEIEKIRFEGRLQYSIEVEKGLDDVNIPHFLLQPLVENAVKYGYDKQSDTITVDVKIIQKEAILSITIYDNGKHFVEMMEKGYGLRSVSAKLKLLYPDKHEIMFVNTPKKHVLIELKNGI